MKFTLLKKLLILLLVLIVIPLVIISYSTIKGANKIGKTALDNAKQMNDESLKDTKEILNNLGAQIIRQKAIDVAKQIEVFITDHPTMTIAQLQADPTFSALAVQPVGQTGYTALTDVNTLICYFHSNPKVANTDLHNLSSKLPGFWSVMFKSQGGYESEGLYDWAEADGSMKKKYMYIAVVKAKTADNIQLSVAATTYIDEFSKPIIQVENKNNTALTSMVGKTESFTNKMTNQNAILLVATILLAFIIGIIFSRSITNPIKDLKKAADQITLGDFNAKLPEIKGNDEVADLTASMEMLIAALKSKK